MKRPICATILLLSLTASSFAGLKEKILLVKQTDRKKRETYSLMSSEEFKAEEDEIKAESRLHMKAMSAAEKEWRSNEDLSKKTFPRAAIAVRKIIVITTFTDDEKANEKLSYYMGKDDKAAEKKDSRNRARGRSGRDQEREARAREREIAREALEEQARQIYEAKLGELAQGDDKKEPAAEN